MSSASLEERMSAMDLATDEVKSCGDPLLAHTPKMKNSLGGRLQYVLFQASMDGCLPCVRHLIEVEGLDPEGRSDSGAYSALDFATYGLQRTSLSGCADVADYLLALHDKTGSPALPKDCPAASAGGAKACPGLGAAHCPGKKKMGNLKYQLFHAAADACLPCVRELVEVRGVCPAEGSDSQNYTALDWAQYSLEKGVNEDGCIEVIGYLRDRLAISSGTVHDIDMTVMD